MNDVYRRLAVDGNVESRTIDVGCCPVNMGNLEFVKCLLLLLARAAFGGFATAGRPGLAWFVTKFYSPNGWSRSARPNPPPKGCGT
jgi:hypothetical protein